MKLIPLLMLLALPAALEAQFTFTTNSGTITITKYTGSGGAVVIPGTTNGLQVISIGNNAFKNCSSLSNVTIPDSVTSIGSSAFESCTSLSSATIGTNVIFIGDNAFDHCSSLASVTIPNSVTSIGISFNYCTSLTNITIGNSVTSIGDAALFYYCTSLTAITVDTNNPAFSSEDGVFFNKSQTMLIQYPAAHTGISYTIPNSVTSIGHLAFYGCTGPTNVTIPDSVTSIGSDAFFCCFNLTSVTIPDNVTSIGDEAFYYCLSLTTITVKTNNPAYSSLDGVLFNKNQTTLIQWPGGRAGSFTIPNSVTSIVSYAFSDCYRLNSVTIGTNITSIGSSVFEYCSSLTNMTIPNSVNSIGSYAFEYCSSLTSFTIPNSVTNIGSYAFDYCSSLTNVMIGASVKSIGNGAFYYCTSLIALTVVTNNPVCSSVDGVLFNKSQTTLLQCPEGKAGSYIVPNSATSIGYLAFYGCTSLTNVTIGTNVTYIGDYAFENCSSLASVTIPNRVIGIGEYAFEDCTKLKWVYFQGNAPGADITVFLGDSATVCYMPGTMGWSTTFGGCWTKLWNPQAQTSGASFGVRTNRFGFNITGTSGLVIVVEACTNFANPVWIPLATKTLTSGSVYFSDSQWTNYASCFYRLRSP